MHAVSVSALKNNPAEALRNAKTAPVVVLNRDNPDAVLIGLESGGVLQARVCVRPWPQPCFATGSSR